MERKSINIVWLKRDLRTQDHEPLIKAEMSKLPYIMIYLFEPSLIAYPDTSSRHLQFVYYSIKQLNKTFKVYNRHVEIFYGEAIDIFDYLRNIYEIKHIFSHQESGTRITWDRDKKVNSFCKVNEINWQESQRDGVIRGITNRDRWGSLWHSTMHKHIVKNWYSKTELKALKHSFNLPFEFMEQLDNYPKQYQPAGEKNAWRYLISFADKRGANYQKHISKPSESRLSCSRISPFLAWGNISIKQAFNFIGTHPNGRKNDNAFSAMLTRLHWHCHFIQKFEVECEYENSMHQQRIRIIGT